MQKWTQIFQICSSISYPVQNISWFIIHTISKWNFQFQITVNFPCCRLPSRRWFWFYTTQLFSLHDKHTTLCDEKIYTNLSLLERFPPPISLILSFLQGSVLKQNTSLMQKNRNSCFSCFSIRFQAVSDSNRPIYVVIIKKTKPLNRKQTKQSAVNTLNMWKQNNNNASKFYLTESQM